MMRYAPFTSAPGNEHGEAGWGRHWFAVYHPGKRVEAGNKHGVIVNADCASFVDCVLVPASFCRRKIRYDCLSPLGDNGTDSSEKNRIGTIILGNGLWIITAICC